MVSLERLIRCKRCEGVGADPSEGRRTCEACEGSGMASGRRLFRSSCPRCDGLGYVIVKKCTRCEGEGRHSAEETIKVRIPRGVATGQKLRIRARGNEGRGRGAAGDLIVLVAVAEHPLFRRRGTDLFCEAPLLWTEAVLGAELQVPTLEGVTTIRIPPVTTSDKVFRLAGRGLPAMKGGRRGDLHIKTRIAVPTRLTAEQRALLQSVASSLGIEAHPERAAYDADLQGRA